MLVRLPVLCLVLGLLSCLAASPAPAQPATATPAPGAGAGQSLLLLTPAHLDRLRLAARAHAPLWQRLRAWADEPARQEYQGQDTPGLALASLVLKEARPAEAKALGRLAAECALKSAAVPPAGEPVALAQRVTEVALGLSWAFDAFEEEERRRVAAWLVAAARSQAGKGRGGFDSASAAGFKLAVLAGLAARGQDPRGEEVLRQAVEGRFQAELLPCLKGAGAGGAWFEGANPGARAGLDLLLAASALAGATGQDPLAGLPWLADRLTYLLFELLPSSGLGSRGSYRQVAPGGDAVLDEETAADLVRLQMALLCHLRPSDPAAGWARNFLLDRRSPGVLADHLVAFEFLWLNPAATLLPLTTAPLAWRAEGAGLGFSRADWSERSSWLKFASGPHFAAAQHLDALSLLLYRRGFLMPRGGAYDGPQTPHALNYAIRSLAHNTILIPDPAEYSWYDLRQGPRPRGTYANDGGQRAFALFDPAGQPSRQAPWAAGGWEHGPSAFRENEALYRTARLGPLEERPRFTYLRGEATAAYQGSTGKARRVVRHVFHLRPGGPQDARAAEAVVVVDDLVLARPRAEAGFALHFPVRPEPAPGLAMVGPGRWRGAAHRLKVQVPSSRLEVVCLAPGGTSLALFGGKGEADAFVDGRNYPPEPPARDPAPYRAEFLTRADEEGRAPLIHVLFPADPEDPPPPEAQPLAAGGPATVGVVLKDPRWPRVVAVRLGEPDPAAELSYACPPGESRHLAAGLVPGGRYLVRAGGGRVVLAPAPAGEVTAGPGGMASFLVTETGAPAPSPAPAPRREGPRVVLPMPAAAGD